jgi:hypothetical protein
MNATGNGGYVCPTDRQLVNVEPFADGDQEAFLENLGADDDWEIVFNHKPGEHGPRVENLAANLTDVAYQVALRHGVGDKWLELELDLWRALTEAIKKRFCSHLMKHTE